MMPMLLLLLLLPMRLMRLMRCAVFSRLLQIIVNDAMAFNQGFIVMVVVNLKLLRFLYVFIWVIS